MNYLNKFKQVYTDLIDFVEKKIPLCAAETHVSAFVKQALGSEFEGKYIQGYKNRIVEKDNIGSDKLYSLLALVEEICFDMYGAKDVDARPLSGMNCMALLIMALVDKKSTVMITGKEIGGHPSLASILDNLGIQYIEMPYDYDRYQIDYDKLNEMLGTMSVSFLIFCQSDILNPPNLRCIHLPEHTGIIYDASQTLGLIAAKENENPLFQAQRILLIGGTHKTLPGPTCGLIMTNEQCYIDSIDYAISPTLLRNIQPNNIASLCLALIEQKEMGSEYQQSIVRNANKLGKFLEVEGVQVARISPTEYTKTHQLFLLFDPETTDHIYSQALHYNITLNKRKSRLYTGIRLGVQEITRYGYTDHDLQCVARLIYLLSQYNQESRNEIRALCEALSAKKEPQYIMDDIFMV